MSKEPSFVSSIIDTAKLDSAEMIYRVAARQLAKTIRDPLAAALAGQFSKNSREQKKLRTQISELLSTELGLGLLMGALGVAISSLPLGEAFEDGRLQLLAKELRVAGLTEVGGAGMDLVMSPLRDLLTAAVSALPMEPIRVAVHGKEEEGEDEGEEVEVAKLNKCYK